jgi:hypothetical protein
MIKLPRILELPMKRKYTSALSLLHKAYFKAFRRCYDATMRNFQHLRDISISCFTEDGRIQKRAPSCCQISIVSLCKWAFALGRRGDHGGGKMWVMVTCFFRSSLQPAQPHAVDPKRKSGSLSALH